MAGGTSGVSPLKPLPSLGALGGSGLQSTSASEHIPSRYLCELSGEVMTQPVKATCDGRVYDRTTIESFRASSGKLCPSPPGGTNYLDDPELVAQPELEGGAADVGLQEAPDGKGAADVVCVLR
eukprot:CAMPEP_0182534008 /NCGR_PEP_ID=MMETSP1323-20130603/14868_1 /TAXON_ID=236787 /ORGANISM="Florenciella parvula, Strain RCC1693" /LENGTH=123 /DNA_ID=CAMNT_0024743971 /DNA_START=44 /DNA_END=414 /DNA_ORIENTATION=-